MAKATLARSAVFVRAGIDGIDDLAGDDWLDVAGGFVRRVVDGPGLAGRVWSLANNCKGRVSRTIWQHHESQRLPDQLLVSNRHLYGDRGLSFFQWPCPARSRTVVVYSDAAQHAPLAIRDRLV